MKKGFVVPLIISIVLGVISAQIVYSEYRKKDNASVYNAYVLQSGVYTNMDTLNSELTLLDKYLVINEDNKYSVYVAISTSESNAEKLKKIYNDKGFDIYIKEVNIDDIEFISNLEQYDVLISGVDDLNSIMAINEVVLSSYEEMVIEN